MQVGPLHTGNMSEMPQWVIYGSGAIETETTSNSDVFYASTLEIRQQVDKLSV